MIKWPRNGRVATFRCQGGQPDGCGMTTPLLADSLRREQPPYSTATTAVVIHRLTVILESLLFDPTVRRLPNWPYRSWYRALQYPETNPRAHGITRDLGRRREQAFSHPAVRELVQWAGTRRRDDPCAGAAAALAAVVAVLACDAPDALCTADLAMAVAADIDAALPVRSPLRRFARAEFLADLDLLSAVEAEASEPENPLLPAVVRELLCLVETDVDTSLCRRVEAAVVQAGDWWARHAIPVPTSVDGPSLPGVVPAQRLRDTDRVAAYVSDAPLLHLVTGPHPGRGRPCQVAWRRGLTFWTAAGLAAGTVRPPYEALRWWQSQLASVHRRKERTDRHGPRLNDGAAS